MKQYYYIETFGCQMNKSDSALMVLSLDNSGFIPVDTIEKADIAVFNTCSVRQHAEDRAKAHILSSTAGIRNRGGVIIVAGCMAQRLSSELIDNGYADIVIGPYQSPEIGQIIRNYMDQITDRIFISQNYKQFSSRLKSGVSNVQDSPSWHQWVTITHGCENYCAYCIVPFVRGRLISFPSQHIIAHIEELTAKGIREITLLGQNVNQYGTDSNDMPFYRLLDQAAGIKGIERINFLTSHPRDFSREIVEAIANNRNISRSIHLPLQSGSDQVLKRMNRGYTFEQYYDIIDAIHRKLKDFSISTDLIVGFPGESREDFELTLQAVKRVHFDDAYMYAYSPRKGTPAFALSEDLSREEKIDRLNRLIQLQRTLASEKLKKRIEKVEDTIIEKFSKRSREKVMGRSFLNHVVITPGTGDDIGKRIRVKIESVNGSTLQGKRVAPIR